jgi:sulfide dehydrogenase cytochrome subunit
MKNMHVILSSAAFAFSGLASPALAQTASLGRDLAASCTHCHGTEGRSAGGTIALAGLPKDQIVQKMAEFKAGTRPATVMHQLSKGYTEQQIELIGEYFAKQKAQ